MNLYLVSYFCWEDSENILLCHEQDYSKREFKKFCDEAIECEAIGYPRDIAEYLIEHYDFKYPHVKQYFSDENNVKIIEDGYI